MLPVQGRGEGGGRRDLSIGPLSNDACGVRGREEAESTGAALRERDGEEYSIPTSGTTEQFGKITTP